jgi:DNA repair protein RecO (recombination protein O)
MLSKTKGIVLHSLKYGDTGLVVTIYTEAFGRMSFLLQGVRGKKSPRKANLLQPLFLLDIEADQKPGRELQRVKELKIAVPYTSIPFEIAKSTQAIFLAEILYKVLREEESRPELFGFLFNSFQVLDLISDGIANFHLIFLVQLSRYLGFGPSENYSESSPFFDLIAGTFSPAPPSHPHFMNRDESLIFSKLINMNYQNCHELHIDKISRQNLLNLMIDYYSLHIGINIKIKSLDVLHEIFQ